MSNPIEMSPEQIELANKMIAESNEKREVVKAEEKADERDLSRAQRRMKERRKNRPDVVQPVEITEDGVTEVWYLTALNDADITSLGICMARDGFTQEDLNDQEAQRSFFTAVLCVGLIASETDTEKFFENHDEAKDFYDDPRNAGTSLLLRIQLFELNPNLLGQSKKNGITVKKLPLKTR